MVQDVEPAVHVRGAAQAPLDRLITDLVDLEAYVA
jgi:hypothetical protein